MLRGAFKVFFIAGKTNALKGIQEQHESPNKIKK